MADKKSENYLRKCREIRDIFKHLRKRYRTDQVLICMERNYFIKANTLYDILQWIDQEPVTDGSINYQIIMRDDFHL